MVSHYEPIPRKKGKKKQTKKYKSNWDNAAPSEDGRTYGIDRLNFSKPANGSGINFESEKKSERLLAQRRGDQTENKENRNNITKHECILSKSKMSHYSQILKGYMNTRSGKEIFNNFRILLESRSSSTIVMGNMTSKLKQK